MSGVGQAVETIAPQQNSSRPSQPFVLRNGALDALQVYVFPTLLDRAVGGAPARVWIPRCGTGEHAYLMAMLLTEQFTSIGWKPNIQIFATDSDKGSISVAQGGVYPATALSGLDEEHLRKFFGEGADGQFTVSPHIRECIVFSPHDLLTDPPFSRLDLVSFPTPLAVTDAASQHRIARILHFALKDGGYVLLGAGDDPGSDVAELFERIAHGDGLYRRIGTPGRGFLNHPVADRHPHGRADTLDLLAATHITVLCLDTQLRIKQLTAPPSTPLSLRESDIGRVLSEVAPQFDDQLLTDARRVLDRPVPIERSLRTATNRCYLRRMHPYYSTENRIEGVVVTFTDITGQIEADAQLRRFAAVLRDSADAIMVMDIDGRIRAWNRGAERLYGYSEAEGLELNMRDLVTGLVFDNTLEVMRRVAAGHFVPPFDAQRRTRDGRLLEVSATFALLRDSLGHPESLVTTERDVTARRRVELETRGLNALLEQRMAEHATELQHTEEQIRAILDATADAVITVDMLGRIATFNRAAERIFGYAAAEAIGASVTLLMPSDAGVRRDSHEPRAWQSFAFRFVGGSHEIAGRRKDGTVFPILLSVNAVEGLGLLVAVARDMTEHKALQQEILDVAMLEQRRIGQELHDGTQQELTGLGLLALSLAENLSRSGSVTAGRLAARVAHGIEQANQRIRQLARGMVPVPIDREGLMTALAELARQTTELHRLPCGFECPAAVEIENDNEATHLYRIAQEAVSNAIRHAKASAIWIRLERVDGRLLLEVQDNGIGVTMPVAPGRGVGLRLMEHRCGMIGGTFALEPRADGGTCIVCSVPRVDHD